jgi:uncharacterized protein YjiS (DUF1127 family)
MTAIQLQPCQETARSARRHDAIDALNDAGQWVLATLGVWRRRIRERDQLARMDDIILRDIGLTHAEREFLANKPFWRE